MLNTARVTPVLVFGLTFILVACVEVGQVRDFESAKAVLGGGSTGTEYAGGDAELTPAERRMREQSRNFDKTVWQGALIGATGGALVGWLTGGDTKDVLKGAAIGAVVGGAAGAYVAHKQKEYSTREDQLDSMIADVRQTNRETEEYIETVRVVVAEDKRRLAAAETKYRKGSITQEELAKEKAGVAQNRNIVKDSVSGAREKADMFEGAERQFAEQNPDVQTRELERELETFNRQINTLDGIVGELDVA
jgi:hypothetical protein